MLEFSVFLSKSLYEAWYFAVIVSIDCILLFFDSLGNLSIEVSFLIVNDLLEMLEHSTHLLGKILKVLV